MRRRKTKDYSTSELSFKIISSKFSDRIRTNCEYYLYINEQGENIVSLKENFNNMSYIIMVFQVKMKI